jgi:hypothetical protein
MDKRFKFLLISLKILALMLSVGFYLSASLALDLLFDILHEWIVAFQTNPIFKSTLKDTIFPSLKPLLKCLQEDYVSIAAKSGYITASSITMRITKLTRCLLTDYLNEESNWLLIDEFDLIVTFLVHSLQPDYGKLAGQTTAANGGNAERLLAPSFSPARNLINDQFNGYTISLLPTSFNVGMNLTAGNLISKFNPVGVNIVGKALATIQTSIVPNNNNNNTGINASSNCSIPSNYLILICGATSVSSGSEEIIQMPAHPVAYSLEGIP